MTTTLITGGARSGKSRLACAMAEPSAQVAFVATADAGDAEMTARIAAHKLERPPEWQTIEEPIDVAAALGEVDLGTTVVVDCITLWVSNLMLDGRSADVIAEDALRLADRLAEFANCVVVTNEVGSGVVPDNELARGYRDMLGQVNCIFGQRFDRVVVAVAGRFIEASRP